MGGKRVGPGTPQINAEAFNVKRCESISDFRELEETLETDEEYRKNLVNNILTPRRIESHFVV